MEDLALRLVAVVAFVLLTALGGALWVRRTARVRHGAGRFDLDQLRRVGLALENAGAVGLLLSSPTCAPCRSVAEVLADVERVRPGFRWRSVDAGDHLDLAREHHVLRVPTLFVIDPSGRILARTSGVPASRDLLRVLDRTAATG